MEKKKQWVVVHFTKENTVQACPYNWIRNNGTECLWPQASPAVRVQNFIKNCHEPEKHWVQYECRVLGEGAIYDEISRARRKAATAENTSDLASDIDHSGRRLIKLKRKYSTVYSDKGSTTSDDENYDSSSETSSSSNLKKNSFSNQTTSNLIKSKISTRQVSPLCSTEEQRPSSQTYNKNLRENRESDSLKIIRDNSSPCSSRMKKSTFQLTPTSSRKTLLEYNVNDPTPLPDHGSPKIRDNSSPYQITPASSRRTLLEQNENEPTALPDHEFQKRVFRKLNLLQLQLDKIQEQLTRRENKQGSEEMEEEEDNYWSRYNFPIDDENTLLKLEEELKNERNFKKLVSDISKIGGRNVNEFTKTILQRVITYNLGINYSWEGAKGKNKFSKLELARAMIVAVQKMIPNTTEKDVELCIKNWLRRCKERQTAKKAKEGN